MTLRHLAIFRAVCEKGCHLTQAAQALHITQPAVSLAIRELEDYYGVRLFDRMGRRLQITEAGQRCLDYAVHISSLFQDLEASLRSWDSQGVLRVGASITIGSQFMPGYVKAFSRLSPGTEVRVAVEQSDRLEQGLLANQLDFALMEGVPHHPSLVSQAYLEDRLAVVCSPEGPWAQGQVISQEEFRRQRFLLREHGSGTREVFDRVAEGAGFFVTPAWEATSTTALLNAAMEGLGVAVLPYRRITGAMEQGRVITVEVAGLDFRRSFCIVHHKDKYLTVSARQFIQLCRDFDPTKAEAGK